MEKTMYSFSNIADYMRCPWLYQAKNVRRLERIGFNIPRERGTWFHSVKMEEALGMTWQDAHAVLTADFDANIRPFTYDESILAMPDELTRILEAYEARYYDDKWETESVEESYAFQLPNKVWIGITPDYVIRDSLGGVWCVDYKTVGILPPVGQNIVDLQHTTYSLGLSKIYGADFKGFIFDYVRTKPPTQPRLTKDGSRIAYLDRLDTNYETLLDFVHDNGLHHSPEITDKLARLHGEQKFFRRDYFILPHAGLEQTERELIYWTNRMQEDEKTGIYGRVPLGQYAGAKACVRCPMQLICQTELLGFSTEGAMLEYKDREPLNRDYKEV